MRTAKKIIFAFLAILPFVTLVFLLAINIWTVSTDSDYLAILPFDLPVIMTELESGNVSVNFVGGDEAMLSTGMLVFMPFGALTSNTVELTGLFASVGRMLIFLSDNIGMPLSGTTVAPFIYCLYLAFLGLCESLVSLITFVPRKCAELFS